MEKWGVLLMLVGTLLLVGLTANQGAKTGQNVLADMTGTNRVSANKSQCADKGDEPDDPVGPGHKHAY